MRYFVIFYRAKSVLNEYFGDTTWESQEYPIRSRVVARIKEETGWLTVAIVSVVELTEEDYRSWNAK